MKTKFFRRDAPAVPLVMALLAAALLVSCSDFFTRSLGEWAKRDPDSLIPAVTTGNVKNLVALAENDPDLSLALLKKIASSGSASDPSMRAAALQAAANAAGLGTAILQNAGNINDLDEAKIREIVANTVKSLDNLETVSSLLTGMLPDLTDTDGWNNFAAASTPGDLAMAAAILLAAEAKKSGDPSGYFGVFSQPGSTDAEKMAVALADKAAAIPNDG
ncbi:MAG: hypothetical protein LBB82_01005, partial [Treponema sp.]|nr:hypothetical protein [Treponema sp.]